MTPRTSKNNMAKFTPQYLKKLEEHLQENGYDVRYEKGNFKNGYCLLESKKLVMVNKFSAMETRCSALLEIINLLESQQLLSNKRQELFAAMENPEPQVVTIPHSSESEH
ncbi:MAG TPA: hypothetical protein PKX84_08060 [Bacteroidia bacterium]|nr:hypothetical protein [Bacteroidota bacterium]HQO87590.1 hypothetical protein [Bacteroidia bacterium]HRC91868.1 hypothetical protein [Bacteroidia bacterium]